MPSFSKSDPFDVLWTEVERYNDSVQMKIEVCRYLKRDIDGFKYAYKDLKKEVKNFYLFLERCLYDHWCEFSDMRVVNDLLRSEIRGIRKLEKEREREKVYVNGKIATAA